MASNFDLITCITGLSQQHLIQRDDGFKLQPEASQQFDAMATAAKKDGIKLSIVSAFRSYQRQAQIWQAKLSGKRTVYDLNNQPVCLESLNTRAKLNAVLLFSALPGASRHHWGTDIDLYDTNAVASDYQPRLEPVEYQVGGPFFAMKKWLEQHASSFGFFMPYKYYQQGVAAEPWHISFAPVADQYQQQLSCQLLAACIKKNPVAEQEAVLMHLADIYQQYVQNICR
ncbi:M15 family metallopeptidase [Rheinheimera sp. MMS21-TC3]|uniref:M15 family metallopeptidase n=1 Tax=Rheinheimera sp. MMS21-TC3 TaxID=3072790 RepID=UPI0028C3CF6E|nr:M15 family metallopeptidase [Rheinheimera sp. MMS21-TC3]WNO60818.1 M15 family metallopeptidase [Rheinheimera sp. MMS21-TC3]